MAAESNLGFLGWGTIGSALDQHAVAFHSSALSTVSDMIPMGSYFGMSSNTSCLEDTMLPSVNSSMINSSPRVVQVQMGSCSSSLVLDSVPGLKHDMGFAVEWSVEEQYKLEEGLVKFSSEPNIMKYIKIAATLPDKTVRDIALRCRWMTRKRRKAEESIGKKVNNRMDKFMESSQTRHIPSAPNDIFSPRPFMVDHLDKSDFFFFEVSGINFPARHLLEQNAEAFGQIMANLSSYKIQDNIDLLHRTRSNIGAILKAMEEMPGVSQMPPLPECIDEDLVNILFPNTLQSHINHSSSGMQLKQEPMCCCEILEPNSAV